MSKLQDQLKEVSKALAKLTKQVDRIADQAKKVAPVKKVTPAKKKTEKAVAAKKKAVQKKAPAKKTTEKTAAKAPTLLESVYEVIRRSRNGVAIATLKAKTNLNPRQISNALHKLSSYGKIKAKSRGLYIKK